MWPPRTLGMENSSSCIDDALMKERDGMSHIPTRVPLICCKSSYISTRTKFRAAGKVPQGSDLRTLRRTGADFAIAKMCKLGVLVSISGGLT